MKIVSVFLILSLGIMMMACSSVTVKTDYDREYDFTKNGTSVGYHYEFHTDKGIVTVNTWAMAKALKEAQVVEGCKIKLAHPEKDKYVVEVLAKDITE